MNEQTGPAMGDRQGGGGLSRRDFLRAGTGVALLGGAGSLLAACASSGTPASSSSTSSSGGKPVRGGTLTAALTGGDSSDTLDGQKGVNNVDFARIVSLYDALVSWDSSAKPYFALAESITPNKDATLWTIRLRKGVTFHNGKDLTAADVIYSFQRVVKNNLGGASSLAICDVANMKARDALTVEVPCKRPYATFVEAIIGYYYYLSILPEGFDASKPAGTGPFKYQSFTPGEQSVFTANEHYWKTGLPYVDKLVISDYGDETSQVNALSGGQADCVNLLSAESISTVQAAGAKVAISDAGGFTPFTMRVDSAPYSSNDLRQALRYVVDRPQMIQLVFGGHGTLGNDIFSPYDPYYDTDIPQRVQDVEKAKFLWKKAGSPNLTLVTSDLAQGTLRAAQVLQQQASQAGIPISLKTVPVTTFYGPTYLTWAFAQDYWYYSDYLPQVAEATLPISPFNETHWNDPHYTALYNEAISTLDDSKRRDIAHEMQMIDYTQGGYIIPYFPPVIDGYGANVHGIEPCKTGLSLSNYGFDSFWKS